MDVFMHKQRLSQVIAPKLYSDDRDRGVQESNLTPEANYIEPHNTIFSIHQLPKDAFTFGNFSLNPYIKIEGIVP